MHHSSQFCSTPTPHLGQHPVAPEVLMEIYLVVPGTPFPAEANPFISPRRQVSGRFGVRAKGEVSAQRGELDGQIQFRIRPGAVFPKEPLYLFRGSIIRPASSLPPASYTPLLESHANSLLTC
jgi:hypothetical protein